MLKRFLIGSVFIVILLTVPSSVFAKEKLTPVKGPIIITSETLTADDKTHTVLFEISVIAKTSDMTIYADKMLVYYDNTSGDVIRIESNGNVKLIKDNHVITSDEAVYLADKEEIIFSGKPRATDGNNVVTGTKMTYFLKEDRSIIENSKVFIKNK